MPIFRNIQDCNIHNYKLWDQNKFWDLNENVTINFSICHAFTCIKKLFGTLLVMYSTYNFFEI